MNEDAYDLHIPKEMSVEDIFNDLDDGSKKDLLDMLKIWEEADIENQSKAMNVTAYRWHELSANSKNLIMKAIMHIQ